MAGKMVWHGEQVRARIVAELMRRIKLCCLLVVNRAKELLSGEGTGQRKQRGRDGKGRYRKKLVYNANPSEPGEPPHVQTGHLRRSVASEVDGLTGRVGTNLLYGRWLELGTRLMAARPWLRRALTECRDQIRAILTAPMKS